MSTADSRYRTNNEINLRVNGFLSQVFIPSRAFFAQSCNPIQFSKFTLKVKVELFLYRNLYRAAINGQDEAPGWPTGCYGVSKLGVCALSRIQQRQFNQDAREDLIVNTVHPGWVDTDMTRHRGILKIEEGIDSTSNVITN